MLVRFSPSLSCADYIPPTRKVALPAASVLMGALVAVIGLRAAAATQLISTADALSAALAAAVPGDELVLEDGTYRGRFALERSGTAERPITIRAQHPQRATFSRSVVELKGSHGVLSGFILQASQVVIAGDYNRVAHNLFRLGGEPATGLRAAVLITGGASHNRIHHNELTDWATYGFRVHQPDRRTTGNRIDHNYIHDYSNTRSSNEPEVFQVGSNNTITHLNVATVIEYNLVERVRITGELLSLKTSGNVVRGNTFIDIHGTVQGRHGNENTLINNTIIGGKSVLRAYGDRHRLIGNRLVGADLVVPSGDVTQDALQKPDGKGGHPAARDQLVAANIVEAGGTIYVGKGVRGDTGFAAENTTLAGNIGPVVDEGPDFKHRGITRLAAYEGDAGRPVVMKREQVGPGAPDPLRP